MPKIHEAERFPYLKAYRGGDGLLNKYTVDEILYRPLIWSEQSRSFYLFKNVRHLVKYLRDVPAEDQHYYEVIYGHKKQRPKFDIDGGGPARFAEILRAIRAAANGARVIVCDSSGPEKFSRHVIIDHWVKDAEAAKEIMEEVVSEVGEDNIDTTVYKKIQMFRLTGSSKLRPGAPRKKIITRGVKFEDTLIGYYRR